MWLNVIHTPGGPKGDPGAIRPTRPQGNVQQSRGLSHKRSLEGLNLPDAGAVQRSTASFRKLAHRAGQRPPPPTFSLRDTCHPRKG